MSVRNLSSFFEKTADDAKNVVTSNTRLNLGNTVSSRIRDIESDLRDMKMKGMSLKKQIDELESTLNEIRLKVSKYCRDIKDLDPEKIRNPDEYKAELERKRDELRKRFREQNKKKAEFKKERTELVKKCTELRKELTNLEKEVKVVEITQDQLDDIMMMYDEEEQEEQKEAIESRIKEHNVAVQDAIEKETQYMEMVQDNISKLEEAISSIDNGMKRTEKQQKMLDELEDLKTEEIKTEEKLKIKIEEQNRLNETRRMLEEKRKNARMKEANMKEKKKNVLEDVGAMLLYFERDGTFEKEKSHILKDLQGLQNESLIIPEDLEEPDRSSLSLRCQELTTTIADAKSKLDEVERKKRKVPSLIRSLKSIERNIKKLGAREDVPTSTQNQFSEYQNTTEDIQNGVRGLKTAIEDIMKRRNFLETEIKNAVSHQEAEKLRKIEAENQRAARAGQVRTRAGKVESALTKIISEIEKNFEQRSSDYKRFLEKKNEFDRLKSEKTTKVFIPKVREKEQMGTIEENIKDCKGKLESALNFLNQNNGILTSCKSALKSALSILSDLPQQQSSEDDLSKLESRASSEESTLKKIQTAYKTFKVDIVTYLGNITTSLAEVTKYVDELTKDVSEKVKAHEAAKKKAKEQHPRQKWDTIPETGTAAPANPGSTAQAASLIGTLVKLFSGFIKRGNFSKIRLDESCTEELGKFFSDPQNVLEELDLTKCGLTDKSFVVLANMIIKNEKTVKLKTLKLGENDLRMESMISMGKILLRNQTIQNITLDKNNSLPGEGFGYLLKCMLLNPNSALRDLNLYYLSGGLDFGASNSSYLSTSELQGEKNTSLTRINFVHTPLKNCRFLGEIIAKCESLSSLSFKYTSMNDTEMGLLVDAVKDLPNLSYVDFGGSTNYVNHNYNIHVEGVKKLCEVMKISKSKFTSDITGLQQLGDKVVEFLVPDRIGSRFNDMGLTSTCISDLMKFFRGMKYPPSTIDISKNKFTNTDSLWNEFIFHEDISAKLGTLDISYNRELGNDGMMKLASGINDLSDKTKLRFLMIHSVGMDNNVDMGFWEAIFSLSRLYTLSIGGNDIGEAGIANVLSVIKSRWPERSSRPDLYNFRMNSVKFSSSGLKTLKELMCYFTAKRMNFELNDCGFTDESIIPIFQMAPHINCYVYLKNNKFGVPALKEFVRSTNNEYDSKMMSVTILKYFYERFDGGVISDSTHFSPSHVDQELVNLFTDHEHGESVLGKLSLPEDFRDQLRRLIAREMKIVFDGTSLSLCIRFIESAKRLKEVMEKILRIQNAVSKLEGLRSLDVSQNKFGDESVPHLIEFLEKCPKLEMLDISNCGLTDTGLSMVLVAMKGWTALKVLRSEGNQVGEKSFRLMSELKEKMRKN